MGGTFEPAVRSKRSLQKILSLTQRRKGAEETIEFLCISLPLVGDVVAVGMTATQLADTISQKLKEYKENPQVSIVVREVSSYSIYVLGEVARAGKYPLKSKTALLQAITLSGGFTPSAARNKIVVFRFGDHGAKDIKIRASYDDIILREDPSQNLVLAPGDTSVIPSETMVLMP